jgi:GST-like protein
MTTEPLVLWQNPGWGSAIVEVQAAFYGLPLRLEAVGDLFEDAAARARLAKVNPLCQIPTMLLPGGAVMTESAAITLYLADLTGSEALVPGPAAAERAAFLRWLVFLVAAIYPTFIFGDMPERYVAPDQAENLQTRMIEERQRLWLVVEAAASEGPWFLGSRFSALDIYLACMVNWRPGQDWFAEHCPKLARSAAATAALPQLAAVMDRNFG